jgi:two-component system nitrogen regulation sensor histidine kinase NtrY
MLQVSRVQKEFPVHPAASAGGGRRRLRHSGGRFGGRLSLFLFLLILASVLVTYGAITRTDAPLTPDSTTVRWLTAGNLVLIASLGAVIAYRLFRLWSSLREGGIGSRLQTRVITVFSIVTILPTVIVSVFTALLLNHGIQSWFDDRVSTALTESVAVAQSYLEEHKETLRADAIAMAGDVQRELHAAVTNPTFFNNVVNAQTSLRSLAEALVLQDDRIIGRSRLSFSLTFERLPPELMEQAAEEGVVIFEKEDKIFALARVDELTNTYLLISRFVDSKVLSHMEQAGGAASEYERLRSRISGLQVQFFISFVVVSLLLLLTVIWYGIVFASRLVVPLSRLIKATERVRAGDFSIRVDPGDKEDGEISTLIQRFNRMTEQLQAQRRDLTLANRTMDARRRFTEAVLEGASAGVIALDPDLKVTLYNRSASQLMEFGNQEDYKGTHIHQVMPELSDLLDRAHAQPDALHQGDVVVAKESRALTLHVRVTVQRQGEKIESYIATFDDISALVSAQRRAAWSDVARRIAHEIKNPLTPIQLATERLRKKYLPPDKEEQAAFTRYLDTIGKHVGDIGSMVEEFVSFARMPQPMFRKENLLTLLNQACFSAQTGFPEITFSVLCERREVEVICDERQMGQVFTNLFKNAAEAVERRQEERNAPSGAVSATVSVSEHRCVVEFRDNGTGFPPDKMEQMMEPYVTTRARGTGLGLAIVKKIVEDHQGSIQISNREEGGALVIISFPIAIEIRKTTV